MVGSRVRFEQLRGLSSSRRATPGGLNRHAPGAGYRTVANAARTVRLALHTEVQIYSLLRLNCFDHPPRRHPTATVRPQTVETAASL